MPAPPPPPAGDARQPEAPFRARRAAWLLDRRLGRRLAAGVLLAVGAAGLWRTLAPRAADTLTLGAPAGRRLVTTLPDGTRLVLNAGSRVRLAAGYGAGPGGARELTLDGEAYFAVVRDARHPFRVRAGGATVEDLGTRFAVRAYAEEGGRVEVAVAEGRVALGVPPADSEPNTTPSAPAVALEAGEVARVDARGTVTRARADVARRLAWAEGDAGVLVLDDVPLGEAVAPLARWLDLDLRLGDSTLAARRGRARLASPTAPGAPTGADALAALARALRVRAVRDGRTVTLLPVAP